MNEVDLLTCKKQKQMLPQLATEVHEYCMGSSIFPTTESSLRRQLSA